MKMAEPARSTPSNRSRKKLPKMKIGIVGTGITGLSAAFALSQDHDVTLFNDDPRPGGHSHTLELDLPEGPVPVDAGFIVFNRKNYPNFNRLLEHFEVPTQVSDMTFGVSIDEGGLEFKGGFGLSALFAQRRNLIRPRFLKLLRAIVRFHEVATNALLDPKPLPPTLSEFLTTHGLHRTNLGRDYLYPMMAAIWSGTSATMGDMPTGSFLRFFHNHGLLSINGKPLWYTVSGGAKSYVQKMLSQLKVTKRFGTPIQHIERRYHEAIVVDAKGQRESFDEVILATHCDQALRLLGPGASEDEQHILSAIPYAPNRAYMHTDTRLMPRRREAWSSWNYLRAGSVHEAEDRPIALSYWMNNLQNLPTKTNVFLTLNPETPPADDTILHELSFDHPQFGTASAAAQARLAEIQGQQRVWFAGAWAGYGFHEDGCQAGLAIAETLGSPAPWARKVVPVSSAVNCVDRTSYLRRALEDREALAVAAE